MGVFLPEFWAPPNEKVIIAMIIVYCIIL